MTPAPDKPMPTAKMRDFVRPGDRLRALQSKEPRFWTRGFVLIVAVLVAMILFAWGNQ